MKKRKGLVSNSSGSSFIIGLGIVKNVDALIKEIEATGCKMITEYGISIGIKTVFELLEDQNYDAPLISANKILLESFDDYIEKNISEKDFAEDTTFVFVNITNGEGDNPFIDEYGTYDFSVATEDYFDEEQQNLIRLFRKSKNIIDGVIKFGAGRDG